MVIIRTLFLLGLTVGCAILPSVSEEYGIGYHEKGIASWYGEPFHGRRTANGEVYDMFGLSAAHRLLPLGSQIKVTNLKNGRSVTVPVNDRGPFVRGRILDLSYGAADRIKMVQAGTVPVEIKVVKIPKKDKSSYAVQVGSFVVEENAWDLSDSLGSRYQEVSVDQHQIGDRTYFRVLVGDFSEARRAHKMARSLGRLEGLEPFVVRRDP